MRELSVAEQRYKVVLAVIGDGRSITEVAASWGISRQTLHVWLSRWEPGGLEGLADRSHRPASCPHQLDAWVEVQVLEARWGSLTRFPGLILTRISRRLLLHLLGAAALTWASGAAAFLGMGLLHAAWPVADAARCPMPSRPVREGGDPTRG